MNLFWLKYASYAFLAGAVFFYFVLRLGRLGSVSRAAKLSAYCLCIILACVAWHVQESNAEQHSPRQLAIGTVISVSVEHHRGGSISDNFQLRLGSGSLSPKFSAYLVASSADAQPIHQGDQLGVLYRTWDDVPMTIDELEGQRAGWHYQRFQALSPYVWTVAGVGFFAFIGALLVSGRNRRVTPTPATTSNGNE